MMVMMVMSSDKIPQVITRFYLSPHSPPTCILGQKYMIPGFASLITSTSAILSSMTLLEKARSTACCTSLTNFWVQSKGSFCACQWAYCTNPLLVVSFRR